MSTRGLSVHGGNQGKRSKQSARDVTDDQWSEQASHTSVEPEEEWLGRRPAADGLGEVVEERAPGRGVHRHVPGVLLEVHAGRLAGQLVNAVVLLAPHGRGRRVPGGSVRRRRDRQRRRLGRPRRLARRPAQARQVVALPRPCRLGRGAGEQRQREAEHCQERQRSVGGGGGPHGDVRALSGGYGAGRGRARARRAGGRPVYIGMDMDGLPLRAGFFFFFPLYVFEGEGWIC